MQRVGDCKFQHRLSVLRRPVIDHVQADGRERHAFAQVEPDHGGGHHLGGHGGVGGRSSDPQEPVGSGHLQHIGRHRRRRVPNAQIDDGDGPLRAVSLPPAVSKVSAMKSFIPPPPPPTVACAIYQQSSRFT